MSDTTVPSAVRLSRIETLVKNEPALKDKLSRKTVSVVKRDGSKVNFSQSIVDIGLAIQADGKDAISLSKKEILLYASKTLGAATDDASYVSPEHEPVKSEEAKSEEAKSEEAKSEEAKSVKINYAVPCLALIVGAKQMAGLTGSSELVSILEKAQELAIKLQ